MIQLYKRAYFLTSVFYIICYSSFGQQRDNFVSALDSLIQTKTTRPFNGVILITQNEKIKYSKAYGYADFNKGTPLKMDDHFIILSNSKQITAVLVLREVEKGRIALHSPIKKYMSDFAQSWADTVTVHHLLNHTSGIVDLKQPLAFEAGTQFKYSDTNYILLGKIIESVSKETYETQVNKLFESCGMKNSFFPNADNQKRLINGYAYAKDNSKKEIKDIIIPKERIPAAGIVTTAKDLSIWNHQLHNGNLLKKSTYKLMTSYSVKAQHKAFGEKEIGYGYGIRINDSDKIKELGHTGIVPEQGFTSINLYYPATKTSVIVLENQAFENFDISYHFEIAVRQITKQSNILNEASQ